MKVRTVAILTLFVLFLKETKSEETQETDETIEVATGGYVEIAEEPQSCDADIVGDYMHIVLKNRLENVNTKYSRVFSFVSILRLSFAVTTKN